MDSKLETWNKEQMALKSFLSLKNTEQWQIALDQDLNISIPENLKLIGGIDISFDKENNEFACVCISVIESKSKSLLKVHHKMVIITEPYVVNYLAFRESPCMISVIKEFLDLYPDLRPQVILVDGNGTYHPSGFGSACHLGVLMEKEGINIPTIGVSKNYLQLEGMPNRDELKEMIRARIIDKDELLVDLVHPVTNTTICTVRRAARKSRVGNETNPGSLAFISPGHGISLKTAVNVVRLCSKCRVPEPILQADHYGKDFLKKHKAALVKGLSGL